MKPKALTGLKVDTLEKRAGAPRAVVWHRLFLSAIRNSANVRASCQAAGVSRATAYKARVNNKEFAGQWDEAEQDAVDLVEAKLLQVALAGDVTGMIFFLKHNRPAKYAEPRGPSMRTEVD